ncbi:hypothetical protein MC885_008320, partial [Smutsia gigantea]
MTLAWALSPRHHSLVLGSCVLGKDQVSAQRRPKHQLSSSDIEVVSTGTPLQQESPELYRKGTTPSDLTPDDSPLQSFPASPTATPPPAPASRNKVAHFSRQVSVDEERGGDIQMLLEGRGGDYVRNSWGEERAGGSRASRGGALRSSQPTDDFRTRGLGHKPPSNPKPRERRTESPPAFSWTSHHRASNPSSGGPKLLELDEEKLSNYEMEMKPLLRMDAHMQEAAPQKRRYSKGGACRGLGEDHRSEDRGFGAQRPRSKSQNKESSRPAPCVEPAVQRLGSLRLGGRAEPRLLRWDLAFSPPQKSSPVARESDEESGDELKPSTDVENVATRGRPVWHTAVPGEGGSCYEAECSRLAVLPACLEERVTSMGMRPGAEGISSQLTAAGAALLCPVPCTQGSRALPSLPGTAPQVPWRPLPTLSLKAKSCCLCRPPALPALPRSSRAPGRPGCRHLEGRGGVRTSHL